MAVNFAKLPRLLRRQSSRAVPGLVEGTAKLTGEIFVFVDLMLAVHV
jgi:hypothetical protein